MQNLTIIKTPNLGKVIILNTFFLLAISCKESSKTAGVVSSGPDSSEWDLWSNSVADLNSYAIGLSRSDGIYYYWKSSDVGSEGKLYPVSGRFSEDDTSIVVHTLFGNNINMLKSDSAAGGKFDLIVIEENVAGGQRRILMKHRQYKEFCRPFLGRE